MPKQDQTRNHQLAGQRLNIHTLNLITMVSNSVPNDLSWLTENFKTASYCFSFSTNMCVVFIACNTLICSCSTVIFSILQMKVCFFKQKFCTLLIFRLLLFMLTIWPCTPDCFNKSIDIFFFEVNIEWYLYETKLEILNIYLVLCETNSYI